MHIIPVLVNNCKKYSLYTHFLWRPKQSSSQSSDFWPREPTQAMPCKTISAMASRMYSLPCAKPDTYTHDAASSTLFRDSISRPLQRYPTSLSLEQQCQFEIMTATSNIAHWISLSPWPLPLVQRVNIMRIEELQAWMCAYRCDEKLRRLHFRVKPLLAVTLTVSLLNCLSHPCSIFLYMCLLTFANASPLLPRWAMITHGARGPVHITQKKICKKASKKIALTLHKLTVKKCCHIPCLNMMCHPCDQ